MTYQIQYTVTQSTKLTNEIAQFTLWIGYASIWADVKRDLFIEQLKEQVKTLCSQMFNRDLLRSF